MYETEYIYICNTERHTHERREIMYILFYICNNNNNECFWFHFSNPEDSVAHGVCIIIININIRTNIERQKERKKSVTSRGHDDNIDQATGFGNLYTHVGDHY